MSDPVTTVTAPASSSALPVPVETNALVGYPHITFADLAVISLTAVGVIVAAMAVILGVLAIFGWQAIRKSASARAEIAGKAAMDKHLASPEFHEKLRLVVEAAVDDQIRGNLTITIQQARAGGIHGATDTPFNG